jgi:hypothetical protein
LRKIEVEAANPAKPKGHHDQTGRFQFKWSKCFRRLARSLQLLYARILTRYTGPAMLTRRRFALNTAATAIALASRPHFGHAQSSGTYHNPILGGDHPDASPIRVGEDFYLTHSSFDYAPGLLIWHSRDLINWRPVAAALTRYHGNVYAPYLCEYQSLFYIYFPADGRLRVVHADHPIGPWSEPTDLGINAIDPLISRRTAAVFFTWLADRWPSSTRMDCP